MANHYHRVLLLRRRVSAGFRSMAAAFSSEYSAVDRRSTYVRQYLHIECFCDCFSKKRILLTKIDIQMKVISLREGFYAPFFCHACVAKKITRLGAYTSCL